MALDLMRGGTIVRQAISSHLQAHIPGLLTQARADWNLQTWEMPDVEDYQQYDRNELDVWPAIGINVISANNFGRVDYEADTSQIYLTRYNVAVYTWVRTPMDTNGDYLPPTYENTLRLRDDYAAIVRNILLRTPSFGSPTIQFFEETMSEEYGEPIQVKGSRWVCGVKHQFAVQNEESTAIHQTLGDADTIVIDSSSDDTLGGP